MAVHVRPLSCVLARLLQNWICRITHSTFDSGAHNTERSLNVSIRILSKSVFTLTKLPMTCCELSSGFHGVLQKRQTAKLQDAICHTCHLCKKQKCCLHFYFVILSLLLFPTESFKKVQQKINFYFNMTEKGQKCAPKFGKLS